VFREIDSLRVMGRVEPERVYELMGRAGCGAEPLAVAFESALARYRARDWDGAELAFGECLKLAPEDGPSRSFLDRIRAFRQTPPPADWDGVWVALGK
jgi:adenylate cyclase